MSESDLKSLFQISEIEITYKNKIPYHERIMVDSPKVASDILRSTWDTGKIELVEQFKIMLLDLRCNCLGISEIGTGGMETCIADPKVVFVTALKARAARLILAHNHPSGTLKASDADMLITKRMVMAGQLLDIPVVDHLIITPHGYYSFADHGLMPGWEPDVKARPSLQSPNIF